ncbi:MAG: gluconate 2-dehydrogenase subunit 3 family protein [Myxococcota bacterium]
MNTRLSRRELLLHAASAAGGISLGAAWLAACSAPSRARRDEAVNARSARVLDAEEWRFFSAVQAQLLPSGPGSPGAREINATGYLDAALSDAAVDLGDVERLRAGVATLQERARTTHGKAFADVDAAQQEALLKAWQRDEAGEEWLGLLLVFTLEALLGDPVYGGNPDGVGWHWLEHHPGMPRPRQPHARGRA